MSVEDIDDGHILGKESLNKLIASVSTEKTVTTITAKEFLARREKQTSDKAKTVVRCEYSDIEPTEPMGKQAKYEWLAKQHSDTAQTDRECSEIDSEGGPKRKKRKVTFGPSNAESPPAEVAHVDVRTGEILTGFFDVKSATVLFYTPNDAKTIRSEALQEALETFMKHIGCSATVVVGIIFEVGCFGYFYNPRWYSCTLTIGHIRNSFGTLDNESVQLPKTCGTTSQWW